LKAEQEVGQLVTAENLLIASAGKQVMQLAEE